MDGRSWWSPIDIYCERLDPGFWAEPVNALSNVFFLIAAGLAYARWRRTGGRDLPALGLIALTILVGIGSFLFHTFANRWSLFADVGPITFFILAYFFLAMRRFLGLRAGSALALTAAFQLGSMAFVELWGRLTNGPLLGGDPVNGSADYFPAVLALLTVGGLVRTRAGVLAGEAGHRLLAAGGVLVLSLVFRSIDRAVCPAFTLGTHFLWHGLNAVVLFLLLGAVIPARAREGRSGP
ncbi:hypothetical protein QNA08_01985 [Chelatococcus sp. SYSU_G07232]|uniref:Ceramidase n=1 Tax=Chelatococcus albus TaxID=3047466 RepID=A0ABT7ACB7_9HYPH|nr:hypothetical protein [Chelatococcus sp. SYSU_G07232]MDJ1157011.1 hypothetical protein [Chelatococcus sp. SYSU_G07232]